jgi:hypothetical protein
MLYYKIYLARAVQARGMPFKHAEEVDEVLKIIAEMKAGYIELAERHKKLQDMHIQLLSGRRGIPEV